MGLVLPAPPELKDGGQATVDDLIEINLGLEDGFRPIFISARLSSEEQMQYQDFLRKNWDVFAWNYSEMLGLDPNVAIHRLAIDPTQRPIKKYPHKARHDIVDKIDGEVEKLLKARFIHKVWCPKWLANIVPVQKENS